MADVALTSLFYQDELNWVLCHGIHGIHGIPDFLGLTAWPPWLNLMLVFRANIYNTIWLFNIAMENCPFIDGLPGFTY